MQTQTTKVETYLAYMRDDLTNARAYKAQGEHKAAEYHLTRALESFTKLQSLGHFDKDDLLIY